MAQAFKLFRSTRHYRYRKNILGPQAIVFSMLGFQQRSQYLLRRFNGRQSRQPLRVKILAKLHPCRTARGKMRQRSFFPTMQKLRRLFPHRHIGGKGRVKHSRRAALPPRRHMLLRRNTPRGKSKGFAKGHARRRRQLNHSLPAFIRQRLLNALCIILFPDSASRTVKGALPAMHANSRITHRQIVLTIYSLHIPTDLQTLTAKNAFAIITAQGRIFFFQ